FAPQDAPESAKVALVNDAFVRKYLAGADPVGQRFRRGNDNTWYTIAGVIGDMRRQMLTKAPIPEVVWPHAQRTWGMNLVVRSEGTRLGRNRGQSTAPRRHGARDHPRRRPLGGHHGYLHTGAPARRTGLAAAF